MDALVIAREMGSDAELTALLLAYLAEYPGDSWREELSHHLQAELDRGERARVRDLALMIAGACGEAE